MGIDGMHGFGDVWLVDCHYQRRGDVTGGDEIGFSRVYGKLRMFSGIECGVVAAIFGCLDNSCIMLFL